MLTGLDSHINGLAGGRSWSVSPVANVTEFSDSGTDGAIALVDGVTDWSGSFSAYGHTPLVLPGAGFTFLGSNDGTNGATGTAIADGFDLTLNQETMAPIECVVNFSGNGALTLGAAAGAAGAAALPLCAVAGCIINDGSDIEVRSSKLSLTRDNKAYNDTSTDGAMKREMGRLSGTLSWSRYCDTFADLGALNAVVTVKLYVTAALYWEIKYAKYVGPSDITVDRETGELIGATENLTFTALNGDGTIGSITPPVGAAY